MFRWLKCLSVAAGGLCAVSSAGLTSQALAQDGAMTELYGYGVHRYYAGDYSEAQRVLNIVVEAGIEDPRPHYFRGLTQHQLGMLDAAKADFEHAADLEAHGRRAVNVSFALQRIQGPVRQEIEMVRMMARVAVYQEQVAKGQVPPDSRRAPPLVPAAPSDSGALPPGFEPAPDAVVVPPLVPGTVPTVPDSQVNPFQDEPPPAPMPEIAAPLDPSNPFGSEAAPPTPVPPAAPADPAPTAPTEAADPFSAPAAPAAPAEPAPAADASNPFGT